MILLAQMLAQHLDVLLLGLLQARASQVSQELHWTKLQAVMVVVLQVRPQVQAPLVSQGAASGTNRSKSGRSERGRLKKRATSACVCVQMELQLQQEEAKKMLDAMKDDMQTVRCIHDSYVRY